jgi:HTH-type transcriptional regulator, sugar sensing transcriptional regulator
MNKELPEMDFQRFWRRLQQIGLNAYEARSYLVLVGHPRFKALELAARSHVPRQKIYEVLDSLIEKGFAQVVQEKTKLFSVALRQRTCRRPEESLLGRTGRTRHSRLPAHCQ